MENADGDGGCSSSASIVRSALLSSSPETVIEEAASRSFRASGIY